MTLAALVTAGALIAGGAYAIVMLNEISAEDRLRIDAPPLLVPATSRAVEADELPVTAPELRVIAATMMTGEEPSDDDVPKPPPPPGRPVILPGILFQFRDAKLTRNGRLWVAEIADKLSKRAVSRIRIEGYADACVLALYNLDLSRRRACAVAARLRLTFGSAAPEMEVWAFGEAQPAAPNIHRDGSDNPAGRKRNRRVVVVPVRSANSSPNLEDSGPGLSATCR